MVLNMKKLLGFIVVALLLVFIALIVFRKDNIVEWETVVEKYETPESRFFTWNNQKHHYTQQGDGADTIVMIHGFGGSFDNFTEFAKLLETDFTIFRIDLPGFGLSEVPSVLENPPKDMMAFHEDYFDTFSAAVHLDSFHLIGNSMGGMVSWSLASENKNIKTLTLLNSAGYNMSEVKETVSGWMTSTLGRWLLKKGVPLSKSKENGEACLYDDTKAKVEAYTANYFMNNKRGTYDWMIKLVTSDILPDTTLIQNVSIPTLIVWGENDKIIPVEHAAKFKRDLKNSQLVIYDKCGHIPQVELPQKLVTDWLSFIQK